MQDEDYYVKELHYQDVIDGKNNLAALHDRVRMIEVHIKAHSKVNVDSPANRERFLYMLSDGALILAPPGKTP